MTTQAGRTAKDVTDAGRQDRHRRPQEAGRRRPAGPRQGRRRAPASQDAGEPGQEGRDQEVARRRDAKKAPHKKADQEVGGQEGRQLTSGARRRLDAELVRRGLVDSRQEAQAAVEAGNVLVSGAPAEKPARLVAPDEPIVARRAPVAFRRPRRPQARAALDRFPSPSPGRRALDAGASTGGFTDCLLQSGAAHVYAVDVGHGQLHPALRDDPRVTVLERTNVRTLALEDLRAADPAYEPCPLVVADLSFISLRSVVPALTGPVATPGADLVLLVKPQFEAGRRRRLPGQGRHPGPGAVARCARRRGVRARRAGTGIMGAMASPLTGAAGNVEFLVHARKGVGRGTTRGGRRPAHRRRVEAEERLPPAAPAG